MWVLHVTKALASKLTPNFRAGGMQQIMWHRKEKGMFPLQCYQ